MLKKFLKNKGLTQFSVRLGILFVTVFALQMFIMLYFRHTQFFIDNLRIPEIFYFPWLTGLRGRDFRNAAIFSLIIFIIWNSPDNTRNK